MIMVAILILWKKNNPGKWKEFYFIKHLLLCVKGFISDLLLLSKVHINYVFRISILQIREMRFKDMKKPSRGHITNMVQGLGSFDPQISQIYAFSYWI